MACTMQPLLKFNNLEERSIEALNAKCRSGRKVKLPLSSLVVANTGPNFAARIPVTVIMIVIRNRKTRICHNRKVNLLFKRFLTLCFLVSEFVADGQSSCMSKCIITVDIAPSQSSDEPLDSVSHKMLQSSLQMIILFIQFLKDKKINVLPNFDRSKDIYVICR